ncbi:GNAT family N-acetyltransferase [Amycolatopsis echigonensis]|uniref:GNAT family N-acetyltransferase n=1 Tax=Amycolatopsis echigonensis TaxID=2576905 RepID=UPI0028AD5861|nr:GNAT family N-acetyltransferase [Amycolatopsis echigonensis]
MDSSVAGSSVLDSSVLDNAAWASLTGPHAGFAERAGQAVRYPADVSVFLAVPDEPSADVWDDVAALAGPGAVVPVFSQAGPPPPDWELLEERAGVQLVDAGVDAASAPEAVRLTVADVPEMLDLVGRTKPGPFLPRTVLLGTYLGIRHEGALVAMAGERLHPPGWTEISAVCTDPAYRDRGLAGRLVRAVAAGIRDRGETPFMHAAAANVNAIRRYEGMGFRLRRRTSFGRVRIPDDWRAAA